MKRPGALLIAAIFLGLLLTWEIAEMQTLDSAPPRVSSPAFTPSPTVTSRRTPAPTATTTATVTTAAATTAGPTAVPTPRESAWTHISPPQDMEDKPASPATSNDGSPLDIATYPPNEMGDILVLVYHNIGRPEARWTRTPENLRGDLDYLLARGYYPVNLIDVARANLDHVPKGRRPIVLTFDDSTAGHFRYLEDGTVDPDCAAGILNEMHKEHGVDWPLRATFFVLLNAKTPGVVLFRQPGLGPQKVRTLVDWGMEVASHTITHPDLGQIGPEEIKWELAVSQARIEALVDDYQVRSFALPYGSYPADISLLEEGYSQAEDLTYQYEAAVTLGAKPAPSPFSTSFNPFLIPRVQAIQSQLDAWFSYYESHLDRYYVSDGGKEEQLPIWLLDPTRDL